MASEREELARELRRALDELDEARSDAATARADLRALQERFSELAEASSSRSAEVRVVANTEFLARQRRDASRRARLLKLVGPVRDTRLFAPIERLARRLRASRRP
jgi:chromosome segregation ATPase